MIFLVGCHINSRSEYQEADVAAIVRGEEITVGELRFLYSDHQILDQLDGTIKVLTAKAKNQTASFLR